MKIDEIRQKAREVLEQTLGEIPSVASVSVERGGDRTDSADFLVNLTINDTRLNLVVDVKSSGQPRFARETVNRFLLLREEPRSAGAYPIFMAPYISETSSVLCRNSGVGCLDFAGNVYIAIGSIFIDRQGRKNPYVSARALASLYNPKSSRVVRVLLADPRRSWKLQDLSTEAGVSLGQVSNVKQGLKDREWISEGPGGVKVSDPRALLLDWAEHYSFQKNKIFRFYSLEGPEGAERELAAACEERNIAYALTAFSAAARIAPAVRYNRMTAYLTGEVTELAAAAGFKSVAGGDNAVLAVPFDTGVFYRASEANGVKVVSPIQAFLDLYGMKGRGREASEAILKQAIESLW